MASVTVSSTQGRFVTVDVPGEPVSGLAAINNNGELVATYNLADNTTHTALIAGDVIQKFNDPNATDPRKRHRRFGRPRRKLPICGVTMVSCSAAASSPESITPPQLHRGIRDKYGGRYRRPLHRRRRRHSRLCIQWGKVHFARHSGSDLNRDDAVDSVGESWANTG